MMAPSIDPGQELVDVVDEEDRVVATVTRREIRERNLLHRCTYVLLRNVSGHLPVHRRTDPRDVHPGAYDGFPGGGCAAGEPNDYRAPRAAAQRLGRKGPPLRLAFRR